VQKMTFSSGIIDFNDVDY